YDRSKFATDSSATVDRFTYGEADGWTYSGGANVKLLGDALVAFANRSTSFNTNITVDRNTGTTIPNERSRGLEAGFTTPSANRTATRRYEEAAAKQIYAAFLSYGWRSGRFGHTVRLNANNVFDKLYVGPDLNLALGRQVIFTYSVSFK